MAHNNETKIRFFNEGIKYKVKNIRVLRLWITTCANRESKQIGDINFIFCDDSYLLNINREYLKHNFLTDIITFNNSENNSIISGDIFISIDRAKENAALFKQTTKKEVRRLLVHGLLHLIGYSDKTTKAKKVMRELEDTCLEMLIKNNPTLR